MPDRDDLIGQLAVMLCAGVAYSRDAWVIAGRVRDDLRVDPDAGAEEVTEALRKALDDGGTVEWGVQVRTASGQLSTVADFGSGETAEVNARSLAAAARASGKDVTWLTVTRKVTPWTEAGEEKTGG